MAGWLSNNKIERHELKPGDHIYTWRNYLYAHPGIYVGDEKVIHFTQSANSFIFGSSSSNSSGTPCPRRSYQSKANGVICSHLECFLNGGGLYLFKYGVSPMDFCSEVRGGTCTLAASDPPEHAIYRAKLLLQIGFGEYSVFKNNCEDFAIYCKTGLLVRPSAILGRSGQVTSSIAAANAIVLGGNFSSIRLSLDIGQRWDLIKIPVETLACFGRMIESTTTSSEMTKDE